MWISTHLPRRYDGDHTHELLQPNSFRGVGEELRDGGEHRSRMILQLGLGLGLGLGGEDHSRIILSEGTEQSCHNLTIRVRVRVR